MTRSPRPGPRRPRSRPYHSVLVVAVVVLSTVAMAGLAAGGTADAMTDARAASTASAERPNPCVGTIRQEPDHKTLLTIQGARGQTKTASLLVGVQPDGEVIGIHNDSAHGRWWVYDVDELPNGNLLLATTEPGITVIEEIDPTTGEHVSVHRLEDVLDAHDVDRIDEDEWVLVDKHKQHNRVLVYDHTTEEVVWEYRFDDHPEAFPTEGGGPHRDDWTHVNDVEAIGDGVFMVSVRNFDQVVAIDRDTKDVVWTLGSDDDHGVLYEQHNPDYLEGADGTPTVLVADSRNDRVVEYARENGGWTRTWELRGGGLKEPRDADRLPNGNTLVVDRRGHRVVEVTPTGEVVWEFYTPWQPYDAERYGLPDESSGPTARESNAAGTHRLTGSAGFSEVRIAACYDYLTSWDGGSSLVESHAGNGDQRSNDRVMVGLAGVALALVGFGLWRRWRTG